MQSARLVLALRAAAVQAGCIVQVSMKMMLFCLPAD
jgi:hypothetical protein